jgi:hypothetical protein
MDEVVRIVRAVVNHARANQSPIQRPGVHRTRSEHPRARCRPISPAVPLPTPAS